MNYELVKEEEKILKRDFMKYVEHSMTMHKLVKEMYSSNLNDAMIVEKYQEEIASLEVKSNHLHAILLEDAIWFISKEAPRANHLRFVIGIINSIFDLERICDHAQRIAQFKSRHEDISDFIKQTITELEKRVQEYAKIIADALENYSVMGNYNNCITQSENFFNLYKAKLYESYNEIDPKNKAKNEALLEFITVLKNLDRTVDHYRNILENFVFIKDPDFFVKNKKI
ncbi:PhoU domain-containing protein [Mycoplasmopsis alligatoris]|uniref:PhoU family protein n=1 Tax=Mycoplasmopsis alligatoris A21JP2 TaxID=747682 RepID=D4XV37_9BACT|nr:PhoU domain-containing protein [Mycoplasmopsis alligatoris]EFF41789.1 PhoU family protein [Mycoplasmopsis alligatoris A21JP2]